MGRRSFYNGSSSGEVRRYFGLTQEALSEYLGLSRATLANVEAGRRFMSGQALSYLRPLRQLVPDGWYPPYPPPTEPPPAAPDAKMLRARIAECQHLARQLRWELQGVHMRLVVARHWQQALPALLAAEPLAPSSEDLARLPLMRDWLRYHGARAAAELDGYAAAEYHLRVARAEALETEAAALRRLLPEAPPAP
ncbi:helix-turn-helix transcriptional regulator [Hymenobacter sp. B81]|uniref:helix-turn-helix transcriptional regulator n=1 Tax=Hymenobacter sp. B81 TaxID=3344878 RepID=UPI0037DDB5B5